MNRIILNCLVILLTIGKTNFVYSNSTITHIFTPSVTIKNIIPTDALAFILPQNHFAVKYDEQAQRFMPLFVPFSILSKRTEPTSYQLRLNRAIHFCQNEQDASIKLLEPVETRLDGQPLLAEDIKPLTAFSPANSFQVSGKQEHQLELIFPELPQQSGFAQNCQGNITLQLEVLI